MKSSGLGVMVLAPLCLQMKKLHPTVFVERQATYTEFWSTSCHSSCSRIPLLCQNHNPDSPLPFLPHPSFLFRAYSYVQLLEQLDCDCTSLFSSAPHLQPKRFGIKLALPFLVSTT